MVNSGVSEDLIFAVACISWPLRRPNLACKPMFLISQFFKM